MNWVLDLLVAPIVAFALPWSIPLVRGRRTRGIALLVPWLAGWTIALLAWLGPGLILVCMVGFAGLLEGARR